MKRMIHSYEVVSSLKIGEKEVVIAMDEQNTDGEKYITCFVERDELFERYNECLVSDDYAEIAKIFGFRIANEAQLHIEFVKKLDIPITVITENDCIPDHYSYDLKGKVIAIDTKHLRPEFQRADRQLFLVNGGSGASANFHGNAVFCTNLHTGKHCRWERYMVMGEVKPECMPEWAKEKAVLLKHIQNNSLVFEYGGKQFCPFRLFTKSEDSLHFITHHTKRDSKLGFWEKDLKGSKFPFIHDDFYSVASVKKCDLFVCVDNLKLYCPCANEMYEWSGEIGTPDRNCLDNTKIKVNKERER